MFGKIIIALLVLISYGCGMFVENRVQAAKRRREEQNK